MAGAACPQCGHPVPTGRPIAVRLLDKVTLRKHKCPECRHVYVTGQATLTGSSALEKMLDSIEPPISSSETTPSSTP